MIDVLERSRALGFLGPGPVADHVRHARSFLFAALELEPGLENASPRCLDMGTGGGVPGLVLAELIPSSTWVLLDSMQRRTAVLAEEVAGLGWSGRVEVIADRAEVAARDERLRGGFNLVTARSFAAPGVTAECARGFLSPGGLLVVSDPPEGPGDRWPSSPLAAIGLEVMGHLAGCTVMRADGPPPDHVPRGVGKPGKRPLF